MPAEESPSKLARITERAFQETGGWLLIGLGLVLAAATGSAVLGGSLVAILGFVFSLLLVLSGGVIAPSVRKRVDNHHSPAAFGRTPVVERRVIYPEENCRERCVVCGSRVKKGVVRRYREDITVAGIPLVFGSNSYNHYCLDCARAELHGTRAKVRGRTVDRDDSMGRAVDRDGQSAGMETAAAEESGRAADDDQELATDTS